MPNRIIKESIFTSPNFNELSVYADRHFYRILMLADDYGCFESTPAVVRGICYPLQESIRRTDIEKWQLELREKGIIQTWSEDGHEYSIFASFDKHNSRYSVTEDGKPTRHRRKTPKPPDSILCQPLPAFASDEDYLPNPNPNPNPNLNHNPVEKEINKEKIDKSTGEIKDAYGEFKNVYLTGDELEKLKERFPDYEERIEKLSSYIKAHGYEKRYKDHYATLLNWDRLDEKRGNGKQPRRKRASHFGTAVSCCDKCGGIFPWVQPDRTDLQRCTCGED